MHTGAPADLSASHSSGSLQSMATEVPNNPAIARLARRQHAIAIRDQLFAAGVTPGQLKGELARARWQRLNERVVCMHSGPLTRRQQLWAALLSAHPLTALCGVTVLELERVRGFADPDIHILIPQGSRFLGVPGAEVRLHRVRHMPADDIRLFDALRITLPHRAVVDAATWATDELTAARLLVAGVQQLRIYPALLRREVEAKTTSRHRKLLLLLCTDLEGGAQALSEVEFLRFCKRDDFPRPALQVRMDAAGRRRYLDATFRRADGTLFHVEVDGGVHLKLAVRAKDDIKDNDARLGNKLVLRYASVLIYTDNADAVRQIRTALG
jgi:hypothetical protein